jgi:hypothetical protein
MKELLIKILFWLLKVNDRTKHLIVFDDLKKLKPIESGETISQLEFKYNRALSSVLSIPHFIEWLYLQVIIKQREHIMTMDKEKRTHQRATILFVLWMIEELQKADKKIKLHK